MTNEKTPEETVAVPKTGDNPGRPLAVLVLCIAAAAAFAGITIYRKKKAKAEEATGPMKDGESEEKTKIDETEEKQD